MRWLLRRADHGLRLDETVKETLSLRELVSQNNIILKGVDARLKNVEKVQSDWKADCERKDAEESDEDED